MALVRLELATSYLVGQKDEIRQSTALTPRLTPTPMNMESMNMDNLTDTFPTPPNESWRLPFIKELCFVRDMPHLIFLNKSWVLFWILCAPLDSITTVQIMTSRVT